MATKKIKSARIIMNEAVTERAFRQQVLDLARLKGWFVYFAWNSLHSPAGFPDLLLAKSIAILQRRDANGRWEDTGAGRQTKVIFAELKTEKGKVTPEQQQWVDLLDAYVWRPSDWDEIVKVLNV